MRRLVVGRACGVEVNAVDRDRSALLDLARRPGGGVGIVGSGDGVTGGDALSQGDAAAAGASDDGADGISEGAADPSADNVATVTDGVSHRAGSLDWFDVAQPACANTKISAIKEATTRGVRIGLPTRSRLADGCAD